MSPATCSCSSISPTLDDSSVVDLFPASRDRLRNSQSARTLKRELESLLETNDVLVDEERRRRQQLPTDDTDELVEDVLMTILERNPALQRYFATGDRLERPTVHETNSAIDSRDRYPSRLELIQTYHGPDDYDVWNPDRSTSATDMEDESDAETDTTPEYVKEMSSNAYALQRLVLDAPNDYRHEAAILGRSTSLRMMWSNPCGC